MESVNFLDLKDFVKSREIFRNDFRRIIIANKINDFNHQYAAKISLNPFPTKDVNKMLEIKREVRILSKLNHPYIVKFIGYSPVDFEGKNYPVIVTEYVTNGSLENLISKDIEGRAPKSWTPTKKLINIFGIASIMSYLHKNNINHRDLKPDNVLEDDYLFPKIADFGLSKEIHTNTDAKTTQSNGGPKGTISYMSPETFKHNKYSEATDVYSYAFIVYQIVNRKKPYKTNSAFTILDLVIKNIRPTMNKNVPKCYCDLIQRCWSNNPEDRPTFNEIVQELKKDVFITNDIDSKEFLDYVELVESEGKSFDPSERFEKVSIDNDPVKVEAPIEQSSLLYREIKQKDVFQNLSDDEKLYFKHVLVNKEPVENQVLSICNENSVMAFENNFLDSKNFVEALSLFSSVVFELKSSDESFIDVFNKLDELASSDLSMISVHIYVFNTSLISKVIENKTIPISITVDPNEIPVDLNNSGSDSIDFDEDTTDLVEKAFFECTSLYKVILPSSLTKISKKAFYYCQSLREIEIPETVKVIEDGAFVRCLLLENIVIPPSLSEISQNTFSQCESLRKIILPPSVQKIGSYAFAECYSLEEIEFSPDLVNIENDAFYNCKKLKSFTIPQNMQTIKRGVFYGCLSLEEITIPSSVSLIDHYSFHSCKSLKKVTFENPSSLKILGDYAFCYCSELDEITIPENAILIGKHCFNGCLKLKEISISPKSTLELIDDYQFDSCISLKQFQFPPTINQIKSFAFNKCSSLVEISIPPSVCQIGKWAFNGCESLVKLIVPPSVKKIEEFAFQRCVKLENIRFDASINVIEQGLFKGCAKLESLSIPESVTKIKKNAFHVCMALKVVKFPKILTSIGDSAFNGCICLDNLEIPQSIKKIGVDAFSNCRSLKKIKIPKSFKNISNIGLNENIKAQGY